MSDSTPPTGQWPPIPDGCGILPAAENHIAHESAPEPPAAVPAGFDPTAALTPAAPPELTDALAQAYRRVLARAVALAAAALLFAALFALTLQGSPLFEPDAMPSRGMVRLILGGQLLFVSLCGRYVMKLGMAAAAIVLVCYAAFTSLEYSLLLSPASLAVVFFCAGGMYALTAAWGYWRDADLAHPAVPVFMILAGGALLALVNWLAGASQLVWSLSAVAVVVFALLEGYHAHEIQDYYQDLDGDNPQGWEASVLGALLLFMNSANFYLFFAALRPDDDEKHAFLSRD